MPDKIKTSIRKNYIFIAYLTFYFCVSSAFITIFPYLHSDEPWLAGLSRSMLLNNDFSVTEPFFDVYSRDPHAIRVLFHMIQALFINVFGYELITVRMISLVFAVAALTSFYSLVFKIFGSRTLALITAILLSLDIQFIYASHFARQEMILLALLTGSLWMVFTYRDRCGIKKDILLGILLGLGIGFHPNSFIIAASLGMVYLYLIYKKNFSLKNLIALMGTVSFFALIFVIASKSMDPDFLTNYFKNGEKFGVNKDLFSKISAGANFFADIFKQDGLTYFVPDIRLQLALLSGMPFVILGLKNRCPDSIKKVFPLALASLGIILGMIIIGRYNPTSVIFLIPFVYVIYSGLLKNFKNKLLPLLLICLIFANTLSNFTNYKSTYPQYEAEIAQVVPSDSKTLANLNLGFYFDEGALLDYRNLRYLQASGLTFEEYADSRNIEFIIYSEEMDFIYEKKPAYDLVYGNPDYYYLELKDFLDNHATEIYSFVNPTYGTHVANLTDNVPWKIRIFKVK
ncbi:ArnT family glycosyltransferase [Alkalibacter mobilis]|uniref:ArnT family glycosyltransferase n=1 Tax=Alkalibacter mobilis TaxID=2787712 RepID=UPI00189EB1BE|nr:glycosyltransferase family 39 protein [Alkalibacter mobilis]MBF7096227.1 glycosyltransferase family 39 protein [Alkalibacter mobilis]